MEKRLFLWVVGHSCAGKDTFISEIRNNPKVWAQELNLSFDFSNSERVKDPSIEKILKMAERLPCVLIQWQAVGRSKVQELKLLRKEDLHVVVYLLREKKEHQQAFQSEYPNQSFEGEAAFNSRWCEEYLQVADKFIYVANLNGTFHVVGWRG